jgi:hypothetical protein
LFFLQNFHHSSLFSSILCFDLFVFFSQISKEKTLLCRPLILRFPKKENLWQHLKNARKN